MNRTESHMSLKSFCRTDMAAEVYRREENASLSAPASPLSDIGISHTKHQSGSIEWEQLTVSGETASARLGKSIGTYYTIQTGELHLIPRGMYEDAMSAAEEALLGAIRVYLPDFRIPDGHPYEAGAQMQSPLESAGEEARVHSSASPEWDLGAIHDDRMMDMPPAPVPGDPEPFRAYTVLVVGLGNPALTPDALGPECVSRLYVTRHLTAHCAAQCALDGARICDSENGDSGTDSKATLTGVHRLSAFVPMVLGQTGMETLDLVRGAVEAAKPDLVILVDALAASETDSLVRTVQIATTGIHPGGGIGNRRQPLVKETLGVPVITVGVPTVIGASTLVYRALEQTGLLPDEDAGTDDLSVEDDALPDVDALAEALRETLRRADTGYVAPKDIDLGMKEAAAFLARVLNVLMVGDENVRAWGTGG
ncbi:MAG: GPR endopeptidase [Clostridia bacterium]|nr:GPR endopeptidase [Clostridia bacterium]